MPHDASAGGWASNDDGLAERHLLERRGLVDQRRAPLHADVAARRASRDRAGARPPPQGAPRPPHASALGVPGDHARRRGQLGQRARRAPRARAAPRPPRRPTPVGVWPVSQSRRPGGRARRSRSRSERWVNDREGRQALDLVAEELDPDRLAAGRREDVDQAAADRELRRAPRRCRRARSPPRPAPRRARRTADLLAQREARPARGRDGRRPIRSTSASADTATRPPAASTCERPRRARRPGAAAGSRPEP